MASLEAESPGSGGGEPAAPNVAVPETKLMLRKRQGVSLLKGPDATKNLTDEEAISTVLAASAAGVSAGGGGRSPTPSPSAPDARAPSWPSLRAASAAAAILRTRSVANSPTCAECGVTASFFQQLELVYSSPSAAAAGARAPRHL